MKKKWMALALATVCLLSACTAPYGGDESTTDDIGTTEPAQENEETTEEGTATAESDTDPESDETTAEDTESVT